MLQRYDMRMNLRKRLLYLSVFCGKIRDIQVKY